MTYVLVFSLIFGVCMVLGSYQYLVQGAGMYQQQFVRNVGGTLKDSFLYLDPKFLFLVNLAALVVAAAVGYMMIGAVGAIIAIVVTSLLPGLAMRLMRKRRAEKFVYQLPDCLSSMAAALRAGTNLSRAIEQAAEQQPKPISQEFSLVVAQYKLGRDLNEALEQMYDRVKMPEVELFNSAVGISRSVGGNLADTLIILAETLREKAQMEGKIKAMTAMGRMQGWVVGCMPYVIGLILLKQEPAAMNALFHEPVGWIVIVILLLMTLIAAFMIKKIVTIDV
ncbi:MAG: type II secretion system F family protein [Gammaproteobacteria bacterium]